MDSDYVVDSRELRFKGTALYSPTGLCQTPTFFPSHVEWNGGRGKGGIEGVWGSKDNERRTKTKDKKEEKKNNKKNKRNKNQNAKNKNSES